MGVLIGISTAVVHEPNMARLDGRFGTTTGQADAPIAFGRLEPCSILRDVIAV